MQMREKWNQVKEIVASALERSPDERTGFLRAACGQDDWLRAEVESLLSHSDGADSLLENSPAANVSTFPSSAMIGRQVGAYRIVSENGQGGMAVVYLAERADQEYRKRVAIKMVKPGPNTEEIIRRFRNERQTLAALDHPHIVKLLDGGTTEEGWPYLVMDFVEGVPLDQYCDSHRLSIRERLELFRTMCMAVHYAHQHKVIHRDLKPSNILIASDGIPRLLDFGIAKLLDPEYIQAPPLTTGIWRPMTPEYASPEQVRGETVTNATDIYSLGILLYELLTGHQPYRATLSSWSEIERVVCQAEPPRPSTVVNRAEEGISAEGKPSAAITPELVSAARHTSPEELRRRLQGDLDTIVMMALRKEPQRRYASAEEFSKDIERHLRGLPVEARRATVVYRSEKFLGRHRESVAAVVIATVLMAGLTLWQAYRAKQSSIQPSPNVAQVSARPSIAILGFKNLSSRSDTMWLSTALSEMLSTELAAGEKLRTVPGESVARTKIDLNLPDADSLASDTLTRVRKNLGSDFVVLGSYFDLGKGTGGEIRLDLRLQNTAKGETVATVSETGTEGGLLDLVSRSGARLRQQLGVAEVSQAETAGVRSSLPANPEVMRFYAEGLAKLRVFDVLAARDLLTRAVAADPSFSLAHSALAKAWQTLGYDANAEQESKRALELADKLSRKDHLLVEARYYESTQNWGRAAETYRTLFSLFPDDLDYGLYLAAAQTGGGQGKEALKTLAALAQSSARAKDDPRIDLAISDAAATQADNALRRDSADRAATKAAKQGAKLLVARARATECRALANLGENEKAKIVCEEGKRIYSEAGDRGGLARTLHSMAEVPLNQDDLDTAEKLYRQALSITREIGDIRGSGRELVNLGVVYKKRGDLVNARTMYEEAYRDDREAGDKNAMAIVTGNIANLLCMQGKLRESQKYYQTSLVLSNEVGHKSSAALALSNMAETLVMEGDLAVASKMFQQALTMWGEVGEKSYHAFTGVLLGRILEQRGELEKARKSYLESLSTQEQLGEKGNLAETRLALAELDCDSGKPAEAEPQARAALEQFRASKEENLQMPAQAVLWRALLQQGKLDEARQGMPDILRIAAQSHDVVLRLPFEIEYAYVLAAEKDLVGAEHLAQQKLALARKLGLVQFQLQASLALGEIQMKGKNPAAGRARLEELEKTAHKIGFELIARKAAATRKA